MMIYNFVLYLVTILVTYINISIIYNSAKNKTNLYIANANKLVRRLNYHSRSFTKHRQAFKSYLRLKIKLIYY